jgi:uncharacterized coiled-coil DUF342 family protein
MENAAVVNPADLSMEELEKLRKTLLASISELHRKIDGLQNQVKGVDAARAALEDFHARCRPP